MKKIIILLVLFLSTGCTISRVEYNNFRVLVDDMFKTEVKLKNHNGSGYSYYLPANFIIKSEIEENTILYSNGNYYYLFIDLVSYKSKSNDKYNESFSYYISKEISYKNKNGYLQISKIDNQYFVEMSYNYAKIESYVYYHKLEEAIIGMSKILSSMEYNEKIINSLIEKKEESGKSTDFNIYKPGVIENNYIGNIEEDITDTTGMNSDTDNIKIKLED